jgi:hypothetical protein
MLSLLQSQACIGQSKARESAYAVLEHFSNLENTNYSRHLYLYEQSVFCVKDDFNFVPFFHQDKRTFSGLEYKNLCDNLREECASEKITLNSLNVKKLKIINDFECKLSTLDTLHMAFLSHPMKVRRHLFYIDICVFAFVDGKLSGNELVVFTYLYDTKTDEVIYPEHEYTNIFYPEYCFKLKEFERLPDLKKLFVNDKYMCW